MALLAVQTAPILDLASLAGEVGERLGVLLAEEQQHWARADPWLDEAVVTLADFVLASGGKRIRPIFMLCGYLAAGGERGDPMATDVAVALELLHSFALLHDDVMDGSPTRRGRLAVHRSLELVHTQNSWRGEARRFGEGMAVLIGDLAFALAGRLAAGMPPEARAVWDRMQAELVMGQYLDLAGAARGGVDSKRASRIARLKTGAYTVERPLQLGAALAGRSADLGVHYCAFGRPLGEAFQLRDDLLGVLGEEGQTGKPIGEDLRLGKPTLLLSIAKGRCGPAGQALLGRAGAADLAEEELGRMKQLLVDCGAVGEVEAMIVASHARAVAALERAPLPAVSRAALVELAALALWRQN